MTPDDFARGRLFIQEGKFDKVQLVLRRALTENPHHPKTLELAGDLAQKRGKNSEAIAYLERAQSTYSNNHQYGEAIICLEKLLKIEPAKNELFFRLARAYQAYGLPNEAIKKMQQLCNWTMEHKETANLAPGLREIVNLQPENLALQLAFVKILIALNQTHEAEDELTKLQAHAEEAQDVRILDEIKRLQPQLDGGDEELDPKSRIELGKLLYEIGSKDEAIIEFNKAVVDLLKAGQSDEAVKILNQIIEIDPHNTEAINKLNELVKPVAKPEEKPAETPTEVKSEGPTEIPVEAPTEVKELAEAEIEPLETPIEPPAQPVVEEETKPETSKIEEIPEEKIEELAAKDLEEATAKPAEEGEEGVDFIQELAREVEGFIPATEPQEIPPLEGQIADIEFLLKEAEEVVAAPVFELTPCFDEFQTSIVWETEDPRKKLAIAKLAFESELYESTLDHLKDIKDNRELWPLALELFGASSVKLDCYREAIETLVPAIELKEIPEIGKTELRYILASAYRGLGDFEKSLFEIEHLIRINPNYKDIRELYELLSGKKISPEPQPAPVVEKAVEETAPTQPIIRPEPKRERPKEEAPYPTIEETVPQVEVARKRSSELPEVMEKGERISFL